MIYLLLSPFVALWYLHLALGVTGAATVGSARGLRPFFGTSSTGRALCYACAGILGVTAGACEFRCASQVGPHIGTPMPPVVALVDIAGLVEIALLLGALSLPALARWHADTERLPASTRRTLWTLAAVVWLTMLGAAIVAAFVPELLASDEPGARLANALLACEWGACAAVVVHQASDARNPGSRRHRAGRAALAVALVALAATHAWLALGL